MKRVNPLISVIVPVYNKEAYLRECVDSILEQVYRRIEVILVDDESTDKSGAICDEFGRADTRVHVIHQKNGGPTAACVAGMKAAAGGSSTAGSFSLRAIASTLGGEGVDSLVFFPIAFGGVLPWGTILSLIVSQALLKTAYEVLILPITIAVVRRLKRVEGIDTVDAGISYKWWRVGDV